MLSTPAPKPRSISVPASGVIEHLLTADEQAIGKNREIKDAVEEIIAETGASGLKEMGVVMAALRERHPGAMDFGKAGAMAKAALS